MLKDIPCRYGNGNLTIIDVNNLVIFTLNVSHIVFSLSIRFRKYDYVKHSISKERLTGRSLILRLKLFK